MKRKILIISHRREPDLTSALKKEGLVWEAAGTEQTASLTAAAEERGATDLILLGSCPWSLAHILAAAKRLSGRLILMGELPAGYKPLRLLHRAECPEEAVMLLRLPTEPVKGPTALCSPPNSKNTSAAGGGDSGGGDAGIRPLQIPPSCVFLAAVAGSQARIGCTTQALAAWRYCKALGFSPAVQMKPEPLAMLSSAIPGTRIPGGWLIRGIPCVEDTNLSYDCYIQDFGVLTAANAALFLAADFRLLVAGVKSWELPATANAVVLGGLRAAQNAGMLLSFATEKGLAEFRALFPDCPIAAAPWQPEPWEAGAAALYALDRLLRPGLEQILQPAPELE